MIRGVSGGQKKRVTTGELLVGPSNVLFADEVRPADRPRPSTACCLLAVQRWLRGRVQGMEVACMGQSALPSTGRHDGLASWCPLSFWACA